MAMVNYKMLGFFNRKFKIMEKEPPNDVKEAFVAYAAAGVLTGYELRRFLMEYQGEKGCTRDDVERITRDVITDDPPIGTTGGSI